MPEETFYIKQNDTASFLTRDLKDAFGAPVNEGEFQVTYANGKIQTFPNDGHLPIVITDDISS
jgi:hypothetical protein